MDINDRFVCRYKGSWKIMRNKMRMEKREDEATGGDGVVLMRHIKKINGKKMFACIREFDCNSW